MIALSRSFYNFQKYPSPTVAECLLQSLLDIALISPPATRLVNCAAQVDMNAVRYLKKAWSGTFDNSDAKTVSGKSEPATEPAEPTLSAGNEAHQELDSSHAVPTSSNTRTLTLSPSYEQVPTSRPAFPSPSSRTGVTPDTPVLPCDVELSDKAQATRALSAPLNVYMEDYHDDALPHHGASFHESEHDGFPTTQPKKTKDHIGNDRPRLQLKRDYNRSSKSSLPQYTPPDFASQVFTEQFSDPNDPMPKGYMGTFAGHRFCETTEECHCPCGTHNVHYLTCGHMIFDSNAKETSSCGTNCETGPHAEQPFICQRCREIIGDIYDNRLTAAERERIQFYHSKSDALTIALATEFITKHMPHAKGNIAETVTSTVLKQGRACLLYSDGQKDTTAFADMFRVSQEKMRVFAAAYELNALEKRKEVQNFNKRQGVDAQEPDSVNSTQSFDAAAATKHGSKKHEEKLKTHIEPVPEDSQGIKRTAISTVDDSSDNETLVDNNDSSLTSTGNKKHKKKLETHREPIVTLVKSTKRKLEVSDPSYD
jgi:hypothetical protein